MQVLTTDEAAIQPLGDSRVRDLAWACFSQSLFVKNEGLTPSTASAGRSMFALTESRLQALQALDAAPQSLHKFLDSKPGNRRLGIYFEHLVEFFVLMPFKPC